MGASSLFLPQKISMAFYASPYQATGFNSFPGYGAYPTFINAAPVASDSASQQENSQQPISVSGFAPAATFLPSTQFVPIGLPQVRRPGYNERLIAWRNRQKAFNKYKQATKQAIKQAAATQYAAPAYYPGYGYQGTHFGSQFGTVLPYGTQFGSYPLVFDQAAPVQQAEATYGDFSYSQGQEQQQQHVEEPEIRGTQV